jgi:hypothetical protein
MKRKILTGFMIFLAFFMMLWAISLGTNAARAALQPTVNLGSASSFVVLGESGITNVPTSVITGDMGVSPITSTSITGFALTMDSTNTFSTSAQVTGRIYAADYNDPTPAYMTTVINDMESAYTVTAGQGPPTQTEMGAGTIGTGTTITAGIYKWSTGLEITGDITLSGSASDVWIFQIAGNLAVDVGVHVVLSGGATYANVFWQVAGHTELFANSYMYGTILGADYIAMDANAEICGRLFSQKYVSLISDTVMLNAAPTTYALIVTTQSCNGTTSGYGTIDPTPAIYTWQEGNAPTVSEIASPATGWLLQNWVLDGVNQTETGNTFVLDTSTLTGVTNTLVAVFNPISLSPPPPPIINYTLTIWTRSCNGVKCGYGTTTPPTGVTKYPAGTLVKVTAYPAKGWYLQGWALNGKCYGKTTTVTVTMESNLTLVAVFNPKYYSLTLTEKCCGTTCPSLGKHWYLANTLVKVTEYPNKGWCFEYWLLNGKYYGTSKTVTVKMTRNDVLEAVFYKPTK